ncbi:hypothetical protein Bbelb_060520 [Branchiostoma belcheri]|nr:hypothetical protein Bbelb_060520 [Branchiostoma belcheri]
MEDKQALESGNDVVTGASEKEGKDSTQKNSNVIQETSGANEDDGQDKKGAMKDNGGATAGEGNKDTKQEKGDDETKSKKCLVKDREESSALQSESDATQSEQLFDEEVIDILKGTNKSESEEQEQPQQNVKSTWEIECDQIREEEKLVENLQKARDSLKEVISDVEGPQKAEEFKVEFDASEYGSAIKKHKMYLVGFVRRLKATWNEDTPIVEQLESEVPSVEKLKEDLEKEVELKDQRIAELNELVGVGTGSQTESDCWITEILQAQLDTTSRESQLLSEEVTKAREQTDWQQETLKAMQDRLDEVQTLFSEKKQKKKVVKSNMVKVLRMYSTAIETIGGVSKKKHVGKNSDQNATEESGDSVNGTGSVQDESSDEEVDGEASDESDTDSSETSSEQSGRETISPTSSSSSRETMSSADTHEKTISSRHILFRRPNISSSIPTNPFINRLF